MKKKDELKSLSDDELLRRLSDVLKQSRRLESELVAHISEVDARRLYAIEALPSMFQYCVDVLHFSKAEAYLRIHVARASRRHSVLLTMLGDGRMHLSGIAELARHLTESNRDELLARATHKTKDAIKELVAEIAPKPDVPPVIRKRPVRKAKAATQPTNEPRPDGAAQNGGAPPPTSATAPDDKPPLVEPLSPARYLVQFTASAELRDKLERLTALMPGNDLASIVEAAVTEKLDRLEAKRFGKTKKPRTSLEDADTSPGVRGIAAAVRRFVWERDGGQCTFKAADGTRCTARDKIHFHHDEPYGLGGDRGPENIRLMCETHNGYMAELDYGKEKMDQYRRSVDRVREPSPRFDYGREKKSRFAMELGVVGPHLCQLGGGGSVCTDSPGIVSAFRCCSLNSCISSS